MLLINISRPQSPPNCGDPTQTFSVMWTSLLPEPKTAASRGQIDIGNQPAWAALSWMSNHIANMNRRALFWEPPSKIPTTQFLSGSLIAFKDLKQTWVAWKEAKLYWQRRMKPISRTKYAYSTSRSHWASSLSRRRSCSSSVPRILIEALWPLRSKSLKVKRWA